MLTDGGTSITDKVNSGIPEHPDYRVNRTKWSKFRDVLDSGDEFINRYLHTLPNREGHEDYIIRQLMTYNPAFALAALNDIKNSIVQRMPDIIRKDGSKTYQDAIGGKNGGVTNRGHDMNGFLAEEAISELLGMAKVGIYVDAPIVPTGASLREAATSRPYLSVYRAEEIINWEPNEAGGYDKLLLRHCEYVHDTVFDLPESHVQTFRLFIRSTDGVVVHTYKSEEALKENKISQTEVLDIDEIPFVVMELPYSLLKDAANYQIALLNLCSSDLLYAYKCNFPFYAAHYEPNDENFQKRAAQFANEMVNPNEIVDPSSPRTELRPDPGSGQTKQVVVGPGRGTLVPPGVDYPAFISPSVEPLMASIALRKELKDEIRQVMSLAVSGMSPRTASAMLKGLDQDAVEAGIAFIASIIQTGERQIAKYWEMYSTTKTKPATIDYPTTYSVKSVAERLATAKELAERIDGMPSVTGKKNLATKIVDVLFNAEDPVVISKMKDEIHAMSNIVTDPKALVADIEAALVGNAMGSEIRGYPKGESDVAAKDHAERLARIQAAQTPVLPPEGTPDGSKTGVPEAVKDPKAAKKEKATSQSADTKLDGKGVRGGGK